MEIGKNEPGILGVKISVPIPKLYLVSRLSQHCVHFLCIEKCVSRWVIEHTSQAKVLGLGTVTLQGIGYWLWITNWNCLGHALQGPCHFSLLFMEMFIQCDFFRQHSKLHEPVSITMQWTRFICIEPKTNIKFITLSLYSTLVPGCPFLYSNFGLNRGKGVFAYFAHELRQVSNA